MSNPDSQFIKRFSIIIGLLSLVGIALIFLSRGIAAVTPTAYTPGAQAVGDSASAGGGAGSAAPDAGTQAPADAQSATTAANAASASAAGGSAAGGDGATVYQQVCSVCHAQGIAGAPKVGDAAAWAPRLAQGKAALYDHALHGYNGKAGVMVAKAGRSDLSDASVQAAVDYMLSKSGS